MASSLPCRLRTPLLVLSLAFLAFLALSDTLVHPTMAAPTPIPGHVYRRRGLLSTTLALPPPHRRFDPEAEAIAQGGAVVDAPNVSVRHDAEDVEKRGLPSGSGGRPGSGSSFDKGKPYGRREDVEKRGLPSGSGGRPGSGSSYDKGKPYGRREDGEGEMV